VSKLIIEVCKVDAVENHPNGDRMAIATIKGWKTCISKNPETGVASFKAGDLCVFFPPDSVLPPELCHGPNDSIPGRLNNIKYLHQLPKDEDGNRPLGGRVVACRLRGHVSFGVIMAIDPKWGDDPNWTVGTDVAEHFKITKYEPPQSSNGEADRPHNWFHCYSEIENVGNYSDAIPDGTEVVFTEKIHGKNCRVGFVLDSDEDGNSKWTYMVGSHDVRRKEWSRIERRFKVIELVEEGVLANDDVTGIVNTIIYVNGSPWQVEYVIEPNPDYPESVQKLHCFKVKAEQHKLGVICYAPVFQRSEYWEALTESVKALLKHICNMEWHEPKYGILLFGELFGTQDMKYGLINSHAFRAFDISINNQYLDFDIKTELLLKFGVIHVPVLYRGPFSIKKLEEYTSGPTTLCKPEVAGPFKGREGVVITPIKEVHYCPILNGRRIAKSISADYHARRDGTEFH